VINLTKSEASNRQPQWSPDGNWISFFSDREGANDIFIILKNGTNLKNLTADFDEQIQSFLWSGDSKLIFFVAQSGNYLQIYSADIENGNIKQLTRDQSNHILTSWIGDFQ